MTRGKHTRGASMREDPSALSPEEMASPTAASMPFIEGQMVTSGGVALKTGGTMDSLSQSEITGESSFTAFFTQLIPPGGLLSTVFNLCSICVGAGLLGLPAAANSSGLAMAGAYPVLIAILSTYSLYCLAVVMEKRGCKTYEDMALQMFGRGLNYFTGTLRLINTFGSCVAYIISVGNIFNAIIDNMDSAPAYLKSTSGNRLLTSLLWLVVMLPLVIPRHINSLRYVSTVGVIFIIYFVLMLVVHSCMNGLKENTKNIHVTGGKDDEGIHLFGTGNAALNGLGVFMFAFICQVNAFEVFWDMSRRSASRFTLYSAISMLVCFILYFSTALFGYLDFGSRVTDSVLLMYDPIKEPAVMVAYIGVLVKLCASYPLLAMASRNSIYYAIGWDPDTTPFWRHCVTAILISIAILLCGLFIPKINIVFGFVGAICGGILAFMFPALFIMYTGDWSLKSVGLLHYVMTYTLLLAGVVGMVFGTCATVYSVIDG